MEVLFYILGSVLVVSAISLVGVVSLSIKNELLTKYLIYLVSFSAGAMLADPFLHLLPELVKEKGEFTITMSGGIIGGMLLFFALEKFINWHHCHDATPKKHVHSFAVTNLVGDGFHNFLDGVIIAAAYLVSVPAGIATTVAVIFHEIPQEIGDFAVLLHGGYSKVRALMFNLASALLSVLGAFIAVALGTKSIIVAELLTPFAIGSFLYIAASDLIPELHKETDTKRSIIQFFAFLAGIGAMAALLLLE